MALERQKVIKSPKSKTLYCVWKWFVSRLYDIMSNCHLNVHKKCCLFAMDLKLLFCHDNNDNEEPVNV